MTIPSEPTTRRTVIKAAAWAMPVVAMAATAPLAAASTPPDLICTTGDQTVRDVRIIDSAILITLTDAASTSVDVTIRLSGHPEIHRNLVPAGTPTNGVPHMQNYIPGETIVIPTPRKYDRARGDWLQVTTVHNENCAVLS